MKQAFFIFIMVFLTSVFHPAQAQQRIGLKLGLNSANVHAFENQLDTDNRLALTVGCVGEFDLTEKFGLGIGLLFVGKGFETNKIYRPLYLEAPIRVYYRNRYFTFGVGPYLGVGVAGKIKTPTLSGNLTQGLKLGYLWEDIRFGFGEKDHFTPFDVGMGAEFALRLTRSLRLFTSYNLGLNNVLPGMEQLSKMLQSATAFFALV